MSFALCCWGGFYPGRGVGATRAKPFHNRRNRRSRAARYSSPMEWLILGTMGFVAVLALAPEEVTKVVLAGFWLLLALSVVGVGVWGLVR